MKKYLTMIFLYIFLVKIFQIKILSNALINLFNKKLSYKIFYNQEWSFHFVYVYHELVITPNFQNNPDCLYFWNEIVIELSRIGSTLFHNMYMKFKEDHLQIWLWLSKNIDMWTFLYCLRKLQRYNYEGGGWADQEITTFLKDLKRGGGSFFLGFIWIINPNFKSDWKITCEGY